MSADPEILTRTAARSPLVAALSVYVEPVVEDARVVVLGDASNGLAEALLDLGARDVHVFDPDAERARAAEEDAPRGVVVRPLAGDLDVRDAAFDVAVVPDVGALPDASRTVGRLRRVIDPRGTVIALARARGGGDDDGFADVAACDFSYAELYDLFALRWETVSMTGVLPFRGVVFAELGGADDVAVSVDTRLGEAPSPSVFVVVAGGAPALDPYAIVQVPRDVEAPARVADDAAAFAAAQLKAQLLHAELEEQRARVVAAESRGGDHATRLARALESSQMELSALREAAARGEEVVARLSLERDAMVVRASELEAALVQVQQTMLLLERRLASAEQGILERDDTIATLNAELDARASSEEARPDVRLVVPALDPTVVRELADRAEHAEAALAARERELAGETEALEAQLRERARHVAELEKELARREALVHELVAAVEELRAGRAPAEPPAMPSVDPDEIARLRRKADELALEVARRESELVAQSWRIRELEASVRGAAETPPVTLPSNPPPPDGPAADALARAEDEIAALRQALTQEHAARVAAESGEELERARAELARQAVLLEQLRTAGGGRPETA